jgi:hypothetical protein
VQLFGVPMCSYPFSRTCLQLSQIIVVDSVSSEYIFSS